MSSVALLHPSAFLRNYDCVRQAFPTIGLNSSALPSSLKRKERGRKWVKGCQVGIFGKRRSCVRAVGEDAGMMLEARAAGEGRKSNLQSGDAVVIVDHGSRRVESNAMLHEFVELYKQKTGHAIVEPAHMELAEPSIANAFDRCVEQGATRVIISPYFLFPGRHWNKLVTAMRDEVMVGAKTFKDIPALAAQAAEKHTRVPYLVTAPIGLHELMVRVLEDRMEYCLSRVTGEVAECDMCSGTGRCQQLSPIQN